MHSTRSAREGNAKTTQTSLQVVGGQAVLLEIVQGCSSAIHGEHLARVLLHQGQEQSREGFRGASARPREKGGE
jgi:hypothetical protein